MRNFIDIVTQTKPSKRLDEVFDTGTPKFGFISQFNKFIIEDDHSVEETTWHQDRRPIDPRDKNGKWNVYDNPPGRPAGIMQFGTEEEANAYVERRKRLGSGDHCYVIPPKDMRESSLEAIGMTEDEPMSNDVPRFSSNMDGTRQAMTFYSRKSSEARVHGNQQASNLYGKAYDGFRRAMRQYENKNISDGRREHQEATALAKQGHDLETKARNPSPPYRAEAIGMTEEWQAGVQKNLKKNGKTGETADEIAGLNGPQGKTSAGS